MGPRRVCLLFFVALQTIGMKSIYNWSPTILWHSTFFQKMMTKRLSWMSSVLQTEALSTKLSQQNSIVCELKHLQLSATAHRKIRMSAVEMSISMSQMTNWETSKVHTSDLLYGERDEKKPFEKSDFVLLIITITINSVIKNSLEKIYNQIDTKQSLFKKTNARISSMQAKRPGRALCYLNTEYTYRNTDICSHLLNERNYMVFASRNMIIAHNYHIKIVYFPNTTNERTKERKKKLFSMNNKSSRAIK